MSQRDSEKKESAKWRSENPDSMEVWFVGRVIDSFSLSFSQKIENLNLALQIFARHNALFGDQVAVKIVKGHTDTILDALWAVIMAYYGNSFGFPKG